MIGVSSSNGLGMIRHHSTQMSTVTFSFSLDTENPTNFGGIATDFELDFEDPWQSVLDELAERVATADGGNASVMDNLLQYVS